jgi:hypothetical protein
MLDLGIAAFGNDLVAAWKGSGSDQQLYYSSFDGSSWAPPATIPGTDSSIGPSLCEFSGRLYAAWKGSGSDQQLYYSSFDGSSWAAPATIPGTDSSSGSPVGASLAVFDNKLYAAWRTTANNAGQQQLDYSSFNGSWWAPPAVIPGTIPPLRLETVVDNSESLNVGDADLRHLSWDMIFDPHATPDGVLADSPPEKGSWSGPKDNTSPFSEALPCFPHTVTVNAHIEANWGSGPGWNWQDLRNGFASTLWGVMQAVSNPTGYENYTATPIPNSAGLPMCGPAEFLDWGHYIPARIQITARDNSTGDVAGQVTVRYSTEDQTGGDICAALAAGASFLPLFTDPATAVLAALFGIGTALACGLAGS